MSDPDVEHEEHAAQAYIARALRPYVVAGVDPNDIAAHLVAWIRREGWWPALKPPRRDRPIDPDHSAAAYKTGLELARKALAEATKAERTAEPR